MKKKNRKICFEIGLKNDTKIYSGAHRIDENFLGYEDKYTWQCDVYKINDIKYIKLLKNTEEQKRRGLQIDHYPILNYFISKNGVNRKRENSMVYWSKK
jgi:hypothetical protein